MIGLFFNNTTSAGELRRTDGVTFDQDADLATAVVISLFTDRRADDDDDTAEGDKRGWWGDSFADIPGDFAGSRLWLLRRRTVNAEVLRLAERYGEEALSWMLRDGVAQSVTCRASILGPGVVLLDVQIVRPQGDTWSRAWEVNLHAL